MKPSTTVRLAILAGLISILFGCSGDRYTAVENNVTSVDKTNIIEPMKVMSDFANKPPIKEMPLDINWVNTEEIPYQRPLPAIFNKKNSLTVYEAEYATVIMARVGEILDMPVEVEQDLFVKAENTSLSSSTISASTPVTDSTGSTLGTNTTQNEMARLIPKFTFSYSGTTRGMLDKIASRLGADWRYDEREHKVVYYRYVTETFQVSAQSGATGTTTKISASNSGDGSSSSNSEASSTLDFTIWKSLPEDIKALKSDEGTYSVSEATGIVVVRDIPGAISRIRAYIDKLNLSLEQGVVMDIRVYTVNLTDQTNTSVSWAALFNDGIQTASLITPRGAGALTNASYLLLGEDANSGGDYAGSTAILDRLDKVGKVTQITGGVMVSVNNKPAPVSVAQTIYYIASAETTSTANVGTSTSVTQNQLNVGFFANAIPRVIGNGPDMMLKMSINISRLVSLDSVSVGNTLIERPRLEYRQMDPEVMIRSGQTLLIAGLEFMTASAQRSGIVDRDTWWLGGGKDRSELSNKVVITITPRIYRPGEYPSVVMKPRG